MPPDEPDHELAVPFKARVAGLRELALPVTMPLYHHPMVAISFIMVAACAAQVAVWLMSPRLMAGRLGVTSSAAVHGYLFDIGNAWLRSRVGEEQHLPTLFIICLVCSLLSAPAWYLVARLGIGPATATWTALLWVVHPAFALLAQRPGPLALLFLLTPTCLLGLLWWRRRPRAVPALATGWILGWMGLVGLQSLLLLPGVLAAMALARVPWRQRLHGGLILCAACGTAAAAGFSAFQYRHPPRELVARVQQALRMSFDDGPSEVAREARASDTVGAGTILWRQCLAAPGRTLAWLGRRLARCVYATADGKFQKPLFATMCLFMVPGLWGLAAAWRRPEWRWTAGVCAIFTISFWLAGGLIEPLARELVPAGGAVILLGVIGVTDVYERMFGERAEEESELMPSDNPVASRRGAGYNQARESD